MKLACQESLLPGSGKTEKFEKAKELGFEGIEILGRPFLQNDGCAEALVKEYVNVSEQTGIPVCSICAGYGNYPLDATAEERQQSREQIKTLLGIGKKLGAIGLILVPVFGRTPKITGLSPYKDAVELEKDLLLSQLPELAESAEKNKCCLLIEPLNRYETHFVNRLEQAVEFCEKIDSPYLKIMADFFHMSIEETNIAESIKTAGKWIKHVHLADSNRILPGMGHTDFKPGFAALREIGFQGFMPLECGVPEPKEDNLKKSVQYLKGLL